MISAVFRNSGEYERIGGRVAGVVPREWFRRVRGFFAPPFDVPALQGYLPILHFSGFPTPPQALSGARDTQERSEQVQNLYAAENT